MPIHLPDEIIEAIILAHFGRSPLYTLDIETEVKRRRFLHRACKVTRQWQRLAAPLLLDSVLFETLNQARAFPTDRKKRALVRKITVASNIVKSGMAKLLDTLLTARDCSSSPGLRGRTSWRAVAKGCTALRW